MCLAQGHNTVWPEWGSNLRPLDPESEAITTRPPRSPIKQKCIDIFIMFGQNIDCDNKNKK